MPTLYTFGNTANVSANNFTTLYNSGAGVVNPQLAYGNANVEDFLAVGSDAGGNTVTNIIASGNITAQNFIGNIIGNLLVPGNTGEVVFNSSNTAGVNPNFVFNTGNATLSVTGGVVSGNITASGNLAGNNLSLTGYASVAGNITGNYFFGNGSQLTGLPEIYGNANVAAYLASGSDTLNIVTTANVSGGNIVTSGLVSATGNVWGEYVIANTAIWFGSDVPYEAITSDNLTMEFYTNSQRRMLLTSGLANIQGNLYLNNTIGNGVLHSYGAQVSGSVSASGNITGNYFFGNGSQLTGLPEVYGNANVATFLANLGSNSISTLGNITANNISAVGNVTITGNLVSDDITSTGVTVYGDQVITGNLTVQGNTTTINSNVITTNDKTITVANNQSTGANVNGAGIEAGNPAIATWLYDDLTGSWQSNIAVTPIGNLTQDLGKVTHQWATVYANNITATSNVQAGNVNTTGLVSATGNVTGTYIIGDGSFLTNVTAVATVGGAAQVYLPVKNTSGGTLTKGTPVYATGTVGSTTVLEIAASRADTPSTMGAIGLLETTLGINATGNALSIGSLSNLDTSTYTVGQQLYVAATGGLTASRPTGSNVVQSVGTVGRVNSSTGSITVNIWDINPLPNLGSGNIWIGNSAAYPTEANLATYSGNIGAGNVSVSGNVNTIGSVNTTGNVSGGNIVAAGVMSATGNLRGANIDTAGLISATGNITGGNIITSGYVVTNTGLTFGALSSRITESSNTISIFTENTLKVSIANAGVNIANANLNVATDASVAGNVTAGNIVTVGLISATGNITGGNLLTPGLISASGNVTANYYIGNGSLLTGITGSSSNSFSNISANGTSIVATSATDVLTITPGTNITITGNATTKTITISSTAAGGGETFNPFLLMGA